MTATSASLADAKAPYSAVPGPDRADAGFVVTYSGTGSWRTQFHATPPNQGGKPDTNDARDTSRQSWSLRYRRAITFPTCGQPADGSPDPCASLTGPTWASGAALMAGRVNHKHVDGLYRQFDRTVKCKLQKRPSLRRRQFAPITVRYLPDSHEIGISVANPLFTTLSLFSSQCPKQGESIDRILDFYAVPGFSFDTAYGADRWFASREVLIPVSVLHGSKQVTIPLRDTPAGTPPRGCAVNDPSFERCKTGGSWSGKLVLKARPASARASAHRTAKAKAKAPLDGNFKGSAGRGHKLTLSVSGRSILLAGFEFGCRGTEGATSLNDIPIKKTKKGFSFGIKAHGSITYADDSASENGAVSISGRFSKTGKSARGVLRVKSKRCHDTGSVKWSARSGR